MKLRTITIAVGVLDAAACAAVGVESYTSGSDPATIGFDYAAGVIVAGLFALTGLPALVIVAMRRAPRMALALALAFPAGFVLLFLAVVVVFTNAP